MSGAKQFALIVSLAAVLSAYESVAQPSVAPPEGASDYWECVETFDKDSVIFRAWVLADPDISGDNGIVEANGIHKTAWYLQQGLSHRWNFDLNEQGDYEAAFVIDPDGTGSYYIFIKEKSTAKPRDITTCTKHL